MKDNLDDPSTERFEGWMPNGGVSSEILYLDDDNQPSVKSKATKALLHILDAEGELISGSVIIIK
jgi:hypothetical protein